MKIASILSYPYYQDLKKALKLDENSQVLLISTEGNTDPIRFREIVWSGLYGMEKRPFSDLENEKTKIH